MSDQPNILFVTTDQQRYDTVLPSRPAFLRTPHLDDLARKGIAFRRAYTTCPICVPARCTIMSGQYEWTHGMVNNGRSADALAGRQTLPMRLRDRGYQVQAIGKMHFTPKRARHGFDDCLIAADYFRDLERRGQPHQFHHGLGQNEFYPGMSSVPEPLTYTNWIAEQCVEFLHRRRDPTRPFFLWCSFGKPHPPFDPPEPYYSMYLDAAISPPAVGDWASDPARCPRMIHDYQRAGSFDQYPPDLIRAVRAAYYGLVTQVDYNLGRVFAALQDQDLLRETLIVFTSDHGEFLGDHQLMGKTFWLESAAHIPFIVRPPASWKMPAGQQRDDLVCLADLLPTFVSAAGGTATDVDGRDVFALLRGEQPPREYLEGCIAADGGSAITDGRWKYIHHFADGAELLFDLANDPTELHNLAGEAQHRETRTRLRSELLRRLQERPADARHVDGDDFQFTPPPPALSDAEMRAQNWIGYHTEYEEGDVFH